MVTNRVKIVKRIWLVSGILLAAVIILTVPVLDGLAKLSADPKTCSGYSLHKGCTVDDSGGNLLVHGVLFLVLVFIVTSIYMLVSWMRNKRH